MSALSSTPYKLLWYTIPFIFMIGVIGRNQFIEINYGATYYGFSLLQVGITLSTLLFLNGLLYYRLRHKTKKSRLATIQVVMIISVSFLFIFLGLFWRNWLSTGYIHYGIANDAFFILIFLGLISQGLLVVVGMNALRQHAKR